MAVSHTIDGDAITTIDLESVELVEVAESGNVGEGTVIIDDKAGTIVTTGHKTYESHEDDCTSSLLGLGFLGARSRARGTFKTGASRKITVPIKDLNDLLTRRVIRKSDGKRPAETVGMRMTWLLGSDYLAGLVVDSGFVDYPSRAIDKNDYTNSNAQQVISDLALLGDGRNFFVYPNEGDWVPSLWFRDSNTSTDYSCSLKLSNVLSDIDWVTTFPVSPEATLTTDPELVFSRAFLPFARGTVEEVKASTATAFVERDGVAPTSSVKKAATASRLARRFLNDHDEEDDSFSDTVLLTSSKVGLLRAGMRIQARYSHFDAEGYGDFTWLRILETRKRILVSPGGIPEAPDEPLYSVGLRLSPQTEAGPSCPYEQTEAGTFYPLGASLVPLSADPTDLGIRAISDGFTYYLRPGLYYPTTPAPGSHGLWHFWELGAGGAGSIDYAGDCVQNTLQFMPIGPGTLTVQTETYASGIRPMAAYWFGDDGSSGSLATFSSGDEVDITVTGDCVNIIRFIDGLGSPCGGKWGWSAAEWVPA